MIADRARSRAPRMRDDRGQALIVTVCFLTVLFGVTALAIDMSRILVARHQVQVAADAGALAAAQDLESTSTPAATVTTDATSLATDNAPAATVAVSEPSSTEVQAKVTRSISLPFAHLLGIGTGTVSATAVAEVESDTTQVVDGNINPNDCSLSVCEYYASSSCAFSWAGDSGGPQLGTTAWRVYTKYNTNTTTWWCSSVDLQNCDGAVATTCNDPSGNPINNEVVDLNGNSVGGIYQTLSTTSGAHYVLSFLLTGNPAGASCAYDTFTGYVQINDGGVTGVQLVKHNFTHTNPCASGTETANFQSVTIPFVAQSSQTTLIFQSTTCTTTGTDNTCPSSPANYVFYGPEVTNIGLTYPADSLVQ